MFFLQSWLGRPSRTRAKRPPARLRLDRLEDRSVPAVFTVSTTLDGGAGSLRQAILDANARPGPEVIDFAIPGDGPHRIALLSALPAINDQVTIDGYSQVGALVGITDAAAAQALNIVPLIMINHGLCLGLNIDGVTVIDLHYLQLLMSSGHYQGDTMFKRAMGTTTTCFSGCSGIRLGSDGRAVLISASR